MSKESVVLIQEYNSYCKTYSIVTIMYDSLLLSWEARKIRNNSCPNKLRSQHSAENLAGAQGKLAGKSLLYANININI